MSTPFFKKVRHKKDYSFYFAVTIFLFIGIVTFTSSRAPTGYSIVETSYSINAIALEDGADADVIIAASDFASKHYITETLLTSELNGAEQNTLLVQNLGASTTTITQSGTNLVLEGDAVEGFAALSFLDSTNYNIFSTYDAVQVVDGSLVGVTASSIEQTTTGQITSENICYDSDNGDDPNTYGTLIGTDIYGNVIDQTDQCGSGTATVNDVFEKVCTEDSYTYVQHTCLYGCKNGACLTNNCVDSDGGDNPYEYGTLTGTDIYGNVIDQTDQCGSGTATVNDVFEKVCTDTSYTYTQYTCEYGCFDGVCIAPVSSEAVCGNGVVEDVELCDDGNMQNGDGCTADCTVEVKEGCWETDTGVAGAYSGYYSDYYDEAQQEYSYDYAYDNYCYYDSYSGIYYYADYYCYQYDYDARWYPTANWQACSSGCEEGKGCVDVATVTPSCVDTDNGKDEKTYGETTLINKFGEERTVADTCYSYTDDSQYVVENYCYTWDNNNYLYTDYILCDGVCQNGVCVEAAYTATCEDSDGTALYEYDWRKSASTYGTVTGNDKSGNSIEKSDSCYDSYGYDYVVEQYCNDQNARYENYVFCPGGCEYGVCIEPDWEQSCIDSDATATNAGRDVYTAGTASGIDYYGKEFTYNDYCYYSSWDKTYYVVDYYCAESSYSGVYASSYWDKCPGGCENGACLGSTTTVTPICSIGDKSVSGTDVYGIPYTYYDYCNGAQTLVTYSCSADSTTSVAAETACNCVDTQCHIASMTVAQFVEDMNPVIVIGASAATEDNIAAIDLAGAYGWKVVTDATISDPTAGTYVSIGGPYANKVSEAAFGGQVWDYRIGEALFLVKEHDAGGKTLVISGSDAQDTRNAVKLLIDNPASLTDVYVVERVR